MPLIIHSAGEKLDVQWIANYIVCNDTAEGWQTELMPLMIWPIFPHCLCPVQIITYSVFEPVLANEQLQLSHLKLHA